MRSLTQRSVLAVAGSIILPLLMLGCGANATKPAEDGGGGAVAAAKPGQDGKDADRTGSSLALPSIDPDAVAQMDVELYSRDPTIRFIVDPADYGKVLRLFREGTVERRPMDWKVLGAIGITYKKGGTTVVSLFGTYGGPGAYKVGETYYRGSTDKEFVQALRECQERSKPAKKAKPGQEGKSGDTTETIFASKDPLAELKSLQATAGLSLLSVHKGCIWKLEFGSGTLHKVADLPGEVEPYSRYSLSWAHKKLAGNARGEGVFVLDLASKKVEWFKEFGSYDISWNHAATKLAVVTSESRGKKDLGVFVIDWATRKADLVGPKAAWGTSPDWSADDARLAYHTDKDEIVIVDVKNKRRSVVGKGSRPSWEPGGDRLSYLGKKGYWSQSTKGTDVRKLIDPLFAQIIGPPWRYSEDGKFAAYLGLGANEDAVEYVEVIVVRLKDRLQVPVFRGGHPGSHRSPGRSLGGVRRQGEPLFARIH